MSAVGDCNQGPLCIAGLLHRKKITTAMWFVRRSSTRLTSTGQSKTSVAGRLKRSNEDGLYTQALQRSLAVPSPAHRAQTNLPHVSDEVTRDCVWPQGRRWTSPSPLIRSEPANRVALFDVLTSANNGRVNAPCRDNLGAGADIVRGAASSPGVGTQGAGPRTPNPIEQSAFRFSHTGYTC